MSDVAAVIGIDLGTQSTKGTLVTLDGTPLAVHSVPVDFARPQEGWGEQPPAALEDSTIAVLSALAAARPDANVKAIGLAAQMGGAIGIGADFSPVTPHEMWLDTRADAERQVLLDSFGDQILAENGIIPFVVPRIRCWLRRDLSLKDRLAKVVAPAGYVIGRLSGLATQDAICDRTQANLFGCFDVRRGDWNLDLAGRAGVPPALLPRIADPFEIVGRLSPEVAARCGLKEGIPLAGGMGDGTGGWFAAGGVTPGICIDTSGSSAHFAVTIDHFATDPTGRLSCMPSAAPGRFYLLGFTTSTGLAHRWLATQLGKDLKVLEQEAAAVEPGAGGVIAVPHLNGRVSPFEPTIKGSFIGFDDRSGAGHLYRALLEASAYELADWLAAAQRIAPDVTLSTVVNVGGGAQNLLWNQIKADATGLSFRTARPEVNAARGAALAAAIAVGEAGLDDHGWFGGDMLGSRTIAPDPARQAIYAPWRDSYLELTDQLLPIYRRLAALRQKQENSR